jgi:hypothetical protein
VLPVLGRWRRSIERAIVRRPMTTAAVLVLGAREWRRPKAANFGRSAAVAASDAATTLPQRAGVSGIERTVRGAAAMRATASSCMTWASSSWRTSKPVEKSRHLPSASRNRIQSLFSTLVDAHYRTLRLPHGSAGAGLAGNPWLHWRHRIAFVAHLLLLFRFPMMPVAKGAGPPVGQFRAGSGLNSATTGARPPPSSVASSPRRVRGSFRRPPHLVSDTRVRADES